MRLTDTKELCFQIYKKLVIRALVRLFKPTLPVRGLYYKTFHSHNLQIFIICQSVCPCQAQFPAQFNLCGRGQEPTLEWSTRKVLQLGKLQPYLQTLDQAGRNNHSILLPKFVNCGHKMCYCADPQGLQLWILLFGSIELEHPKKYFCKFIKLGMNKFELI